MCVVPVVLWMGNGERVRETDKVCMMMVLLLLCSRGSNGWRVVNA